MGDAAKGRAGRGGRHALKDEVFLRMALELSRLGTCCRLKVGCILLRPDGGIASGGYNGALPGMPHCTAQTCNPGQRCLHTSHAEENALGFCDGPVQTAYITDEPCLTCTRALIRRGARRVVFLRPYKSIAEQEKEERRAILEHFQVKWEQLETAPASLGGGACGGGLGGSERSGPPGKHSEAFSPAPLA